MTWDSVMVGVDTPSQVVRVGLTLISSLTGPEFGRIVRSRVPETVCGAAEPANEAKRMLQVLNQADGEGRGGVQRYPLSPNPSPQAIPTRPRGIKFRISNRCLQ